MKLDPIRLLSFKNSSFLKKTKMIATIGPKTDDVNLLTDLIKRGMNICRINFSHDNHEIQYKKLENIKKATKLIPDLPEVAIMLDTKGPEIRTGITNNKKVSLKKGRTIKIISSSDHIGDEECISVNYDKLFESSIIGNKILIADGNLVLEILEKEKSTKSVIALIKNDYELGERKNVCLPNTTVDIPVISDKDKMDIVEFGVKHGIDFIALSFTRSKKCIETCRSLLGSNSHIKIIAKIESGEGLLNIDEIMEAADGVMVARGDLGMELQLGKLFEAQQIITKSAIKHKKPVIIATQIMESMTSQPRPTRAEASDLGRAVYEFNDCTMLSGETGNGQYPLKAVSIMSEICQEVENSIDYFPNFLKNIKNNKFHPLAIASSQLAFSSNLKAIIVEGDISLVKDLSALKPSSFIVYPTNDEKKIRELQIYFGVIPLYFPDNSNFIKNIDTIKTRITKLGIFSEDDDKKSVLVSSSNESIRIV